MNSQVARKVVAPTATVAIAEQVAILAPALLFKGWNLDRYADGSKGAQQATVILEALAVVVVGLATSLYIVFPAQVILTRVQASLLSEEEEAIVSFDRSFGGKVVPAIVGGSGRLEMRDAWRTFDWNARVRLFKIYAKVLMMQMALFVLYAVVVMIELRLAVGKQMDELVIAAARAHRAH